MKTIVCACALERELAPLLELPGEEPKLTCGVSWAWRDIDDARLLVAAGGMGTSNTAATTQLLCSMAHPDAYLFYGIAGGLNPELGVGDVVIGMRIVRLEADMAIIAESEPHLETFASDTCLTELAEKQLEALGAMRVPSVAESAGDASDNAQATGTSFGTSMPHAPRYTTGTIATSDLFATDRAALEKARSIWKADCEEMEGAAAAQIAARVGVPFLALRCLSNVCGEAYDDLDGAEERLNATARRAAKTTLGVAKAVAASI